MNFAAFERAQVAAFAYREARHTGSLDCMRAVCFILRNRVKSAWGNGTWLSVIAASHVTAASFDPWIMGETSAKGDEKIPVVSSEDRLLQLIVRDVDDIYLGQDRFDDNVRQVVCGDDPSAKLGNRTWKPVLYYAFVDQRPRPWFVENIVQRPQDHPHSGQIGKMMLYR